MIIKSERSETGLKIRNEKRLMLFYFKIFDVIYSKLVDCDSTPFENGESHLGTPFDT